LVSEKKSQQVFAIRKKIMNNLFNIRQVVAATMAALLLLTGYRADAIDYVWTNATAALPNGMGYWEDTNDWSPNGVPSTNDTASLTGVNVIFSASIYVGGINLTNCLLAAENPPEAAIYLYGLSMPSITQTYKVTGSKPPLSE
jgi:hypothetical protein